MFASSQEATSLSQWQSAATAEQQSSVQALDIVIQRVAQCPDPNLLRDYVETEVQHNVWESSLTLNHTLRDKLQEKRQSMNLQPLDLSTAIIGYGNSKPAANENAAAQLGTMMLCMTHVISFSFGKSHINGPKKIGTMML